MPYAYPLVPVAMPKIPHPETAPGRYRAPGPAKTPFTVLLRNSAQTAKQMVAVALTTGLASSATIPAHASPNSTSLSAADPQVLTAAAYAALNSPTVKVPAHGVIDFARLEITGVEPPPPPMLRTPTGPVVPQSYPSPPSQSYPSAGVVPGRVIDGAEIVTIAKRYVGTPYVFGGKTPAGFDCSGFVSYVYKQVGVDIPSTTAQLRKFGTRIPAAAALPGDLVMYSNVNHVGIYAGNGMMYDAARPGKSLQYREIFTGSIYFLRVV